MPSLDVAYINPFIVAIREVFDSMVHIPVSLGKAYLKSPDDPQRSVSAMIELSGPVDGMVVLSLTQPIALALASGLAGSVQKELDADCLDALGEITSMICGSAKKNLPGGLVEISVPKVRTTPTRVAYPDRLPIIAVPCETSRGRFWIDVALRQKAATPDAASAETTTASPDVSAGSSVVASA